MSDGVQDGSRETLSGSPQMHGCHGSTFILNNGAINHLAGSEANERTCSGLASETPLPSCQGDDAGGKRKAGDVFGRRIWDICRREGGSDAITSGRDWRRLSVALSLAEAAPYHHWQGMRPAVSLPLRGNIQLTPSTQRRRPESDSGNKLFQSDERGSHVSKCLNRSGQWVSVKSWSTGNTPRDLDVPN